MNPYNRHDTKFNQYRDDTPRPRCALPNVEGLLLLQSLDLNEVSLGMRRNGQAVHRRGEIDRYKQQAPRMYIYFIGSFAWLGDKIY